jgi:hypothetical protein
VFLVHGFQPSLALGLVLLWEIVADATHRLDPVHGLRIIVSDRCVVRPAQRPGEYGRVPGLEPSPNARFGARRQSPVRPPRLAWLDQCHTQRARWMTKDSVCLVLPFAVTVTGSRCHTPFEPSICWPVELRTMF